MAFLEQGTAAAPADAILWSDLAAAHLGRAEQGFPEESIQALSAAQRAVTLDGSLFAARFNLALALERNSLIHQARQAWSEYLKIEEDPGWRSEARARQRRLNEPTGLARWERLRPKLDAAAGLGDKEVVREIVADFSYRARAYAEGDLLPQWAEAVKAGRSEQAARALRIAREIGEAVASARGEHLVADSIAAIARRTGSREALTSLAAAYRAQAEGSSLCLDNQGLKGEAPLLEARQAFARVDSPAALSASYHLAVCAYQRGEPKAALSRLGPLLRQPGMDRYPNLLGRSHWMAGLSAMVLAEPGLALDSYQKALHLFEGLGSIPEIGGLCHLLADNQLYLGDRRQAWRFNQRGLALAAAEGDPRRLFSALDKAADIAGNEGLFEEALRFREEVVQIAKAGPDDPPGETHAFLRRAEVRFRLGHEEEALQDLARAEQACARIPDSAEQNRRRADILFIGGKIRAVHHPASAFLHLTRALEIYQKDDFRYPLVEIHLTRARVLRAMDQPLAAERDLRSGIEEFERQRDQVRSEELRIAYFEQARDLFDLLIDLQAGRPGGAAEAFATAERQRARVLLDRLKLVKPGGADAGVALLTLSEAQGRLPDGVALISYESLPARLLVWVLRKDGKPVMQEISLPAATLDKRIAALLRQVESGAGDEALQGYLTALHRDILAPALPYTRPGDLLVFVPDRSLHRLPFAALRDSRNGRYLVEDHASEVVPSASLYLSKRFQRSGVTQPDLLVIANPRFDRRRFEELPELGGALDEADALSGLLGTAAEVLKGEEATREAFIQEAGRHAFVHLATHAFLNADHPHLSGLLLATGGTDESGVLTASEIGGLSFPHTRLVYLGACQSGAGAVATEGVLSLARAFLAAGVPRVVSSLWDVDDAAASRFSRRFYEALLHHESPEEALRTAQLAAIHGAGRDETSLRHWAAFQVSGTRTSHSGEEERWQPFSSISQACASSARAQAPRRSSSATPATMEANRTFRSSLLTGRAP